MTITVPGNSKYFCILLHENDSDTLDSTKHIHTHIRVCVCVCVSEGNTILSVLPEMLALMRTRLSRLLDILKLRTKKIGPLLVISYVKSRIIWKHYRVAIPS